MPIFRTDGKKARQAAAKYKEEFELAPNGDGTLSMYVKGDPERRNVPPPELLRELNNPFKRRRAITTIQRMKEAGAYNPESVAAPGKKQSDYTPTNNIQVDTGNDGSIHVALKEPGDYSELPTDVSDVVSGFDKLEGSDSYSPFPRQAVSPQKLLNFPKLYEPLYDRMRPGFADQDQADEWFSAMENMKENNYDEWKKLMETIYQEGTWLDKGYGEPNIPVNDRNIITPYSLTKFRLMLLSQSPEYRYLNSKMKLAKEDYNTRLYMPAMWGGVGPNNAMYNVKFHNADSKYNKDLEKVLGDYGKMMWDSAAKGRDIEDLSKEEFEKFQEEFSKIRTNQKMLELGLDPLDENSARDAAKRGLTFILDLWDLNTLPERLIMY